MAMQLKFEAECCDDCALYLANGEATAEHIAKVADTLGADVKHASLTCEGEGECEGNFSRYGCSACGSTLAGNRHKFVVLEEVPDKPEPAAAEPMCDTLGCRVANYAHVRLPQCDRMCRICHESLATSPDFPGVCRWETCEAYARAELQRAAADAPSVAMPCKKCTNGMATSANGGVCYWCQPEAPKN